ncbi:MAG: hypothetical protein Q7S22_03860 [Candidatus Micrarchaeota archaeon]|nr:hypothetical protein [Candidatus Micrarchaeota archaeon]
MEKILESIKSKGLDFLFETIQSDEGFHKLSNSKATTEFEEVVTAAIINAGKSAQAGDKLHSHYILHILSMLKDEEYSKRLQVLIKTQTGGNIMLKVAEHPDGAFIIFGTMTANYPLGHGFVSQLLKNREGRLVVIGTVDASCKLQLPNLSLLPVIKETDKGKELTARLQSDAESDKFIVLLKNEQYSDQLVQYMVENSSEAANIIRNILSTKEGISRIAKIMCSESGKSLCSLLGKGSFGKKIGSNYLWLTKEGRALVHELFKTGDGVYAVYAIATGMTAAEFIAYTVSLENKD